MNRQQRVVMLFGLLLISAVLLGCANDSRRATAAASTSTYQRDVDRARAKIAEAERTGAAEFGNAQITLAREKLRAAEDAIEDGETERAEQLAVEADLDAELAGAITRNQQTQALKQEMLSTLRTLEDELRRAEGAGLDRP